MIKITSSTNSLFNLSGTIEHFEAVNCKKILSSCLSNAEASDIHIDISDLKSVSSVTLSFLLFGLREAKHLSKHLHYKNMPPVLFNMARVSGIEAILVSN